MTIVSTPNLQSCWNLLL